MAEEVEVDTRVSASLDPGVIALIEDYDEDTRPLLGQTETALSAAFEALKGIHDAKAAAATVAHRDRVRVVRCVRHASLPRR